MATVRQKCLSASVYRPVMTRDRVNTFLGTHKSLAGMNRRLLPRVLQLMTLYAATRSLRKRSSIH